MQAVCYSAKYLETSLLGILVYMLTGFIKDASLGARSLVTRVSRIFECAIKAMGDSIFTLSVKGDHAAETTNLGEAIESINARAERAMDDYGNTILRLAYSYLHNMSDAEEILQETLIKFIQTAPSLEDREHEKAWLLHVAANLSKNRIKYNSYRSSDELNEELVAQDREDLSFVWDAVKKLPDKFREVIHLFYYEGLSTKQISQVLSRNESTIRSDLKRGRDQLKTVLKEVYDFEE